MNNNEIDKKTADKLMKSIEANVENDATQWQGMLVWEAGDFDTVHDLVMIALSTTRKEVIEGLKKDIEFHSVEIKNDAGDEYIKKSWILSLLKGN